MDSRIEVLSEVLNKIVSARELGDNSDQNLDNLEYWLGTEIQEEIERMPE